MTRNKSNDASLSVESNNSSLCRDISFVPPISDEGNVVSSRSVVLCDGALINDGNAIYGLSSSTNSSTTWHQKIPNDDGVVTGIVSSSSCLCTSTSNGTISLLDKSNGHILMTRSVLSEHDEEISKIQIGFVASFSAKATETLFVTILTKQPKVIVVYDIVKEHISSMKLASFSLSPNITSVQQIRAAYHSDQIIRFIILSNQGKLSILNYDIATSTTTTDDTSLLLLEDDYCCCHVGLSSIYQDFLSFVVCSNTNTNDDTPKEDYFQWVHVPTLTKSHKFPVSHCFNSTADNPEQRFKVLTIEPVSTYNSEEAIGAAIATVEILHDATTRDNRNNKQFRIYIVQLLLDHDNKQRVTNFHIVFYIPLDYYYYHPPLASVLDKKFRLAFASLAKSSDKPYSFYAVITYKNSTMTSIPKYMAIILEDIAAAIGEFHALIARNKFLEADTFYLQQEHISEQYQHWMHPSHVALAQLKCSQVEQDDLRMCIQRLKTAVVAEKTTFGVATICFQEAATFVSNNSNAYSLETLKGILLVLIGATAEIMSNTKRSTPWKNWKRRLEAQVQTMAFASQLSFLPSLTDMPKSTSALFIALASSEQYEQAERVRCLSLLCPDDIICKETIASAILNVNSFNKKFITIYACYWISDCIAPHMHGVYDNLWKQLCHWGCNAACFAEDEDAAISLLECICEATSFLETKAHLSACFNKQLLISCSNRSNNNISSPFLLHDSIYSNCDNSSDNTNTVFYDDFIPTVFESSPIKRQLARRVIRATTAKATTPRDENETEEDDSTNIVDKCRKKLRQARLLRDARALGLPPSRPSLLRSLEDLGGPFYVVVELLRFFMTTAVQLDEEFVANILRSKIQPFCQSHAISNLDEILEFYSKDCLAEAASTCNSGEDFNLEKDLSSVIRVFNEISYLSQYAETAETRGRITLQLLRSGLCFSVELTRTTNCEVAAVNLEQLSHNSMEELFETHPLLSSEIKEASRLIKIDAILCQYCGREARKWFRVSYPDHMRSLIRHVSRFIDEFYVLDHVITLCDAVAASLDNKVNAVTDILNRIMLATSPKSAKKGTINCRAQQCGELIRYLLQEKKDTYFASKVATHVLRFAVHTIEECSFFCSSQPDDKILHDQRAISRAACAAALSISFVLKEFEVKNPQYRKSNVSLSFSTSTWSDIWSDLRRLQLLQTQYSLYLSLSDLLDENHLADTMSQLLQSAFSMIKERMCQASHEYWENEEFSMANDSDWIVQLKSMFARARRGCFLLCKSESCEAWWKAVSSAACNLLHDSGDVACFLFLRASGILEENAFATSLITSEGTSIALLSVVEALISSASNAVRNKTRNRSQIPIPGYEDGESDTEAESALAEPESISQRSPLFKAMLHVVRSSFLIQEYCMVSCPDDKLPAVAASARLIDLICQTLLRADAGYGEALEEKRQMIYENTIITKDKMRDPSAKVLSFLPSLPILHPNWYVGDGLLLPPLDSLILSLEHWKDKESNHFADATKSACGDSIFSTEWSPLGDMYSLLSNRGAHSLTLRLLTLYCFDIAPSVLPYPSFSETYVEAHMHDKLQKFYQDTVRYLAERSLGGAGAGLTSGAVDSVLSAAHLLILPRKVAFKLYRASLPSAINRRDFGRVVTLSVIGVYASGATGIGWTNQQTFLTQCQQLASCGYWWNILKKNGLEFDPGRFDHHKRERNSSYTSSLLPSLIEQLSRAEIQPEAILNICTQFCIAFAIDRTVAAMRVIEFYLSCPTSTSASFPSPRDHFGARENLVLCGDGARMALPFLPILSRIKVLRCCLINLENDGDRCGTDYERYNLILSLLRHELISLMQTEIKDGKDLECLRSELELVDRRIEALALLSSFFSSTKLASQKVIPSYPSFFLPLPNSIGSHKSPTKLCGILGNLGSAAHRSDEFDPLAPLQPLLSSSQFGQITANSLSPICHVLGLPAGYLQSRQLCERFLACSEKGQPLPLFQENVLPLLHRLKFSKDCAELAEWCASRYENDEKERLVCLKHAQLYAMKYSSEVESRLQFERTAGNIDEEKYALDAVKRIGKEMVALEDFLFVRELLLKGYTDLSPVAKQIIVSLIDVARSRSKRNITPEMLVELLLAESSSSAADALVDKIQDFSLHDFRQVAFRVHDACLRISEEHSHVNPRAVIGAFSRRWLVHGDCPASKSNEADSKPKVLKPKSHETVFEDDDTREFVMDLNNFGHGRDMWSDDIGFSEQSEANQKLSVGEEPWGLKANGSAREQVEHNNAKTCLKIAFVLSFAHTYEDRKASVTETDEEQFKENRQMSDKAVLSLNLALGSHARVRQSGGENFARQLLQVAFTDRGTKGAPLFLNDIVLNETKTITFAMRHRALRTALILCPNELIRSVIKENEYFSALVDGESSFAYHLERCKIASYVAMEVEDMGLPLPHSDFAQLSSMHFSSYARALWRHHGQSGDCSGFKGRLLGLLIVLCTAHGKQLDDAPLVVAVLNEIMKDGKLPRTALSSIERIIDCESAGPRIHAIRMVDVTNHSGEKIIARTLVATAKCLLKELNQCLQNGSQQSLVLDDDECYDVMRRLIKAAIILSSLGVERINLFLFASEFCSAISSISPIRPELAHRLSKLAIQLTHRVNAEDQQVLLSKINDIGDVARRKSAMEKIHCTTNVSVPT